MNVSSFLRTGRRAAVIVVLAVLASSLPLAAQSNLTGFIQVDDYLLEIDGERDTGATIYFQQRVPAYLVLPAASNTPLLIVPRTRQVQSVSLMKVTTGPNNTLDLADDAVFARQGQFEILGKDIAWSTEGKSYRLYEKPAFLGLTDGAGLGEYSKRYKIGADSYTPAASVIESLRKENRDAHLRVYFGSWCPFCQRYLPKLVRVERDVGAAVKIDYYGLPTDMKDPVAQQMNVKSVPTAVLFVDGKEVGRFERNDWESPERGLQRLLGR